MGQKVNPISLRLQQTNRYFDSSWFNDYNYTYLINRDLKIKSYINLVLKQIKYSSGRFFLQNLPNKIKIHVFFHNVKSSRKKLLQTFRLREYKKLRVSKLKKKSFQEKNFFFKQHRIYTKNKAKLFYYLLQQTFFSINPQTSNEVEFVSPPAKQKTFTEIKLGNYYKINKAYANKDICKKKLYKKNALNFALSKKMYTPLFFRYLLLKHFSLRTQAKLVTKNFLLSNLTNFKLLNNKKKFFLTINHLKTNATRTSLHSQPINKLAAFTGSSISKSDLETKLPKQAEIKLNTDQQKQMYSALSFINNEPLSKTHNEYRKFANLFFSKNFKKNSSLKKSTNNLFYNTSKQTDTASKQTYNEVEFVNTSIVGKDSSQFINKLRTTNTSNLQSTKNVIERKNFILSNPPYKKHLESVFSNHFSSNVCLSFFQAFDKTQNAAFFADEIVHYLEKRVPFFKIKNQILREMSANKNKFSHIKGLRIICSGRVGGKSKKAQRSKIQNMKYGETSLHVFSSKIDFSIKHALTAFGLIGVKVWVCYR